MQALCFCASHRDQRTLVAVIIVTNPGSNLTADEVREHDIRLTPQQIVVDGEAHDTRGGFTFADIDRWVQSAKQHPHVVGTTASEFVQYFQRLAQEDSEILAVMTSRKIIGSHDAALVAANTLKAHPRFAHVRILVADSGVCVVPVDALR